MVKPVEAFAFCAVGYAGHSIFETRSKY